MMAIYVVTHDGGCEGQSLPLLAFDDRGKAMQWVAGQSEAYNVTAVPVFPELPVKPWYNIEAEPPREG